MWEWFCYFAEWIFCFIDNDFGIMEIRTSFGNVVKVFAETFEGEAYSQVARMAEYGPYRKSRIRIMPDAHAGKGCVVGTTMTLDGAVTPNLVGVDIGCGMLAAYLTAGDIDLERLDGVIRKYVPSGFAVHEKPVGEFGLDALYCYPAIRDKAFYMQQSLGTLGGGNHFIEVNRTADGQSVIVIHSGSRNLGVQVCNYYQKLAVGDMEKDGSADRLIARLKAEGREKEIQSELKKLKHDMADRELAHLSGIHFREYLHDMDIVQRYASMNRHLILDSICKNMGIFTWDYIETVHNYIDVGNMILRKGAVSAQRGERLIIPMNMRDGSLICVGKGNGDWNFSAPHGAGRLMSRSRAKECLAMDDFRKSMEGIYTTSVCEDTIDESPMAYKPMDEIVRLIGDTVEIIDTIRPVYNFKAAQ